MLIKPYLPTNTKNLRRADLLSTLMSFNLFLDPDAKETAWSLIVSGLVRDKTDHTMREALKTITRVDVAGPHVFDKERLPHMGAVSILETFYKEVIKRYGETFVLATALAWFDNISNLKEVLEDISALVDECLQPGKPVLCESCGSAMMEYKTERKKYCSTKCRKAAFDARKRQVRS